MKQLSAFKLLAVLIVGSLFFSSCKRDRYFERKPFKIRTSTWYRVSPTAPIPIIVNGTTYAGFAYFPGGGSGEASHLGNATIFFNQLAYGTAPDAPPAGSIAAAVSDVPGYPVTGAPLPLIQAGDFTSLAGAVSSLDIPASILQNIINTVVYNSKGDAIFLSAITGAGGTFPISSTKVGFNGKALIVTGRGRFHHAAGEVDYNGYFNLVDASDAAFNADGWIAY